MDPSAVREALLDLALGYPEAYEDHPWGEAVVKVGKKIFVFLGTEESTTPGFGVNLPESARAALEHPGVEPTGYNLGKACWVSVALRADNLDVDQFREWIDESYRAVCLKRHLRLLDE